MKRTISVWSDRNIRDQLWRSPLTDRACRIEISLSIWQICFFPGTALLYPTFKDKMAECSDSMHECSICGNRSTDWQVLLMHSCPSITGGLLYIDLITVSVPFKISYPVWDIASRRIISRGFLDQLCFQLLDPIRYRTQMKKACNVMSVISPAPSSDSSNKRRTLEKWEDKHVRILIESYLKYKDLFW